MSKKNKTNMDVIDVQNLYDFKAFKDKDYINFIKRSGGQVFQYYSLLDSYANFLGANGGSEFASDYRETEVTFSREIYKKRVYSSVVLPLYSKDSSTNSIEIQVGSNNPGGEGTGSYDDKSYFKPRVTPSWYDRHTNNFSFIEGSFRNIFKKATIREESFTTKDLVFLSGDFRNIYQQSTTKVESISSIMTLLSAEFRLPVMSYTVKEADSMITTELILLGGSLIKKLIKALIPTESFVSYDMQCLSVAKATNVEKDVLELNFLDLNYVIESPKATIKILDKFSTKISTSTNKYLRILDKRGGVRLEFSNNSNSVSKNYNWTLNFNIEPKELRGDSHLLDYDNRLKIKLDGQDSSKLVVDVMSQRLFTSVSGFLSTNSWYNISLEKKDTLYFLYINNQLCATSELPLDTFFGEGGALTLGNSLDTFNGFVGNISNFIIVKQTALITENTYKKYNTIQPVVASELNLSAAAIKDNVDHVKWINYNGAYFNEELKGLVFSAGQYLITENTPDLSIYNFNNYKIEVELSIEEVPSLSNKTKTVLHKTGVLTDSFNNLSGYSLSVERVDDNAKLVFNLGRVSLYSSSIIQVGLKYQIEIIKFKTQLLMFINNVFESSVTLNSPLDEDLVSNLIVGRFQTRPERDFKGVVYSLKFTNYFKDLSGTDKYMKYLPENLEYEEFLNFEEKSQNWLGGNPTYIYEDYLTTAEFKFGSRSLKLNDDFKNIVRINTPLYNFGRDDFTIEGWYKPTSFNIENILLSNGVTENSTIALLLQYLFIDQQGRLGYYSNKNLTGLENDVLIKTTATVKLNVWSHLVFTRSKGVFRLYINGNVSAQVVANDIAIDLSINDTYIGNNNFKGSSVPIIEVPLITDYIENTSITSKELLTDLLSNGGIITLPDDINGVWEETTNTLTIGSTFIKAKSKEEVEVLRLLLENGYLNEKDLSMITIETSLNWITTDILKAKNKPPVSYTPISALALTSQYKGFMDSIRVLKDEAIYTKDFFEVPSKAFGDTDNNTLVSLSFDNSNKKELLNEFLLDFNPAPSVSKINPVVINLESLISEDLTANSTGILWDFNENFSSKNYEKSLPLTTSSISLSKVNGKSVMSMDSYTSRLYLTPKQSKELNFEQEDFTLEFWLYKYPPGTEPKYFPILGGYPHGLRIYSSTGTTTMSMYYSTATQAGISVPLLAEGYIMPVNSWFHLAIVRKTDVFHTFINGKLVFTVDVPEYFKNNFNWFQHDDNVYIFSLPAPYSSYYEGKVDQIRITKGVALYDKDFNSDLYYSEVPTKSISATLEEGTAPSQENPLYNIENIKFENSGIYLEKSFLKKEEDISDNTDFTLEFYIRFKDNSNTFQTMLSNVLLEVDISEFISIFRYGHTASDMLKYRIGISKNPNDLNEVLILSEQPLYNNIWYNITVIKTNSVLNLYVNGIKDSATPLPDFFVRFKGVGLRLGNSILPNTGLTGSVESFRYTPDLSLYKNSFETENIYITKENSELFKYKKDSSKIYESFSKSIATDIENPNTILKDGCLVTTLPQDTSKTGIIIPNTFKNLNIGTDDFTIEIKIFLEENRLRRLTNVFCNRASLGTSATYISISNKSDVDDLNSVSSISFNTPSRAFQLNFGAKSYIENTWNTISITRSGSVIKGFVNGILKVTKEEPNLSLNLIAYEGLYLYAGSVTQTGSLDYVYILKGKALDIENTYTDSDIFYKQNFYKERFVIEAGDKGSVLPAETFIENLYTKSEEFASVTDIDSLVNKSLNLNTNTYLKLNLLPRIPKDFMVSFWIKPIFESNVSSSTYYSIFKWESDDNYKIEYLINNEGKDKLTVSQNRITSTVGSFDKLSRSLIMEEWNHVIITKYEDSVSLYFNGYRFHTYIDPKYRELYSDLNSNFYLGFNPDLPTNSLILLLDNIKISKYREGNLLDFYNNSLEILFEENSLKITSLDLLNFDASQGTSFWTESNMELESEFISEVGKYYFISKNPKDSYVYGSQTIEVSDYLDVSFNNFYLSWTQSFSDSKQAYDNTVICTMEFYNKDSLLHTVSTLPFDVSKTSDQKRELERYFSDYLPSGTLFIKIKFQLKNYAQITNLKIFVENAGEKAEDSTYIEQYIEPNTYIDHSHAFLLSHSNQNDISNEYSDIIDVTPTNISSSYDKDITKFKPSDIFIDNNTENKITIDLK